MQTKKINSFNFFSTLNQHAATQNVGVLNFPLESHFNFRIFLRDNFERQNKKIVIR